MIIQQNNNAINSYLLSRTLIRVKRRYGREVSAVCTKITGRSMLVTSLLCLGMLLVSGGTGQCPPCPAPPVIPCCRQADQAGLCCQVNSVKLDTYRLMLGTPYHFYHFNASLYTRSYIQCLVQTSLYKTNKSLPYLGMNINIARTDHK